MFDTTRVVLAAAVTAAVTSLVCPAFATAAEPHYKEYVALGDSWSADATFSQITDEFAPGGCVQSARNYPKQVAAALSVPVFRDATCGSAVTANMTAPQGVSDGVNAPQFDRLTPTTDLVTLGIGGNDAGLSATAFSCLTIDPAATPCKDAQVTPDGDRMSAAIETAAGRIRDAISGIRQRAPHARILLLDYLQGVSGGSCFPRIPISDGDAIWLGDKLFEIHGMLARIAAESGVDFVDTYTGSVGHDACQPPDVRWVEGLIPYSSHPAGPAVPMHPTQLGADYQTRRVLEILGA
ncbi:SGNH/GDSL hydrolase family protein [Nocardia australiensis]|uniref:SGNH/GDSL hydrolase family protein n=1 Tax=Nocardia australiensis TaxID=2887191 RepID=UPI001D15D70B|nr:SGNH/GDSL hydrolase family protein [Nocardia australiensis]